MPSATYAMPSIQVHRQLMPLATYANATHAMETHVKACWNPILLESLDKQAKELQESVKVCLSSTQIRPEGLLGFVPFKRACSIQVSDLTKTGKSAYLKNQKSHRENKGSSELVGIMATTFTLSISPKNVVFFDQIAREKVPYVGHFGPPAVHLREKLLE